MSAYPVLAPGSKGPEVADLQNSLNQLLGFMLPGYAPLAVDGVWGMRTSDAFTRAEVLLGLRPENGASMLRTSDNFYNALLTRLDTLDPAVGSSRPIVQMAPLEIEGVASSSILLGLLGVFALWKVWRG